MKYWARNIIQIARKLRFSLQNEIKGGPFSSQTIDAFMTDEVECGTISLEVVVKFINVNYEKGAELLTKCKTMQRHSVLIYKIREKHMAHGDLAAAI